MKTKLTLFTLITVGALAMALADEHTDKGHVVAKPSLTLEGAKQVGEAAAKYAKENGAGPSIAVVDEGGHLLYFTRPETSFAAGANVSIGKARTSAIFKKPTSFFEDTINQGRFTMTALPDFTPLQGGVSNESRGQIAAARPVLLENSGSFKLGASVGNDARARAMKPGPPKNQSK